MQQSEAIATAARHPRDPEPVASTKAAAAYAMGLVAVMTAPFIGGVIPAIIALHLSGQADAEVAESEGFLLGAAKSRRARRLAHIAFGIAGFVFIIGLLWWLYRLAIAPPVVPTVDPNVD